MNLNETLRRRKLVFMPQTRLLQLLFSAKIKMTYVIIPESNLPPDTVVLGMRYEPHKAGAIFEICHESFDIVEKGRVTPELDVIWTSVELARPEGKEKP